MVTKKAPELTSLRGHTESVATHGTVPSGRANYPSDFYVLNKHATTQNERGRKG